MRWSAVSMAAYRLIRPLLFRFDPERIHAWTLHRLRWAGEHVAGRAALALASGAPRPHTSVRVAGLELRNRVGIGAGFDKDGIAVRGWAALGVGFAEVGTVTPLPQPGSDRPRLFRLPQDAALINRMGFNNAGAAELARHVLLARHALPAGFVVGVNIGRNTVTAEHDPAADYLAAYRLVAPVADYVVVNVSSPNTPGLRDLQTNQGLAPIMAAISAEASELLIERPIFVKLAPDLDDAELAALSRQLCDTGARGVILANTTVRRGDLRAPANLRDQSGGLSGRPLLARTLEIIGTVRGEVGDGLAIVASGGIGSGADAAAAVAAGADLVQLWTGLVYRGPGLIGEAIAATS